MRPQATRMLLATLEYGSERVLLHLFRDCDLISWLIRAPQTVEAQERGGAPPPAGEPPVPGLAHHRDGGEARDAFHDLAAPAAWGRRGTDTASPAPNPPPQPRAFKRMHSSGIKERSFLPLPWIAASRCTRLPPPVLQACVPDAVRCTSRVCQGSYTAQNIAGTDRSAPEECRARPALPEPHLMSNSVDDQRDVVRNLPEPIGIQTLFSAP